jgi:hypothetical protein
MRLTPSDLYLAKLLGITPEQMEHFNNEAFLRAKVAPAPAATAGIDPLSIAIQVALAVGSMAISSLLAPKVPSNQAPKTTIRNVQGPNRTESQRVAPTSAFDSVQEITKLQTTIPIIYSNRESIDGESFGGVRVNAMLLWSQMLSFKSHQMFRGVFLLGEGAIAELDPLGFAFGDSKITSYNLVNQAATEDQARYTVYFRKDGGRIRSGDRIAGRIAGTDAGNAENAGGGDVFQVRSNGDTYRPDACMASTPSTTTAFGVYAPIINNVAYRINPQLRPTRTYRVTSRKAGSQWIVDNEDDNAALCSIWKQRYHWSPRSGIVATSSGQGRVTIPQGGTITYRMFRSSDRNTVIAFEEGRGNSDNGFRAEEKCGDIASAVAARQQNADNALVVGTLYSIGTCLAVLYERTPDGSLFMSDVENDAQDSGTTMTYVFTVVREGVVDCLTSQQQGNLESSTTGKVIYPPSARGSNGETQWSTASFGGKTDQFGTATNTSQILRVAIATVTIPRPARHVEIGIRSTLGIQVAGMCNMRDAQDMDLIERRAVGNRVSGQRVPKEAASNTNVSIYQSGVVTRAETRFSFFRIIYKTSSYGSDVVLSGLFGIRGAKREELNNYVRFDMGSDQPWEYRMEPVSGWAVRNNILPGDLHILDTSLNTLQTVNLGGIIVRYAGVPPFARAQNFFKMNFIEPDNDLYLNWTDEGGYNSMIDSWGRLAEIFAYDEVTASCDNGPEHTISYVNTITSNTAAGPQYDNLALAGLNVRSSTEMRQLPQFSAYVLKGKVVPNLQAQGEGPTHLWPTILHDAALNTRYGAGGPMTKEQLDTPSFIDSGNWTYARRYFFDGAVVEPLNLREWASQIAPLFLLAFGEVNGQWRLSPGIDFGPVQISGLFTAGNIQENTFTLTWLDKDEREPVRVSATWRSERLLGGYLGGGFAISREVMVRDAAASINTDLISLPMEQFCTNKNHAIDACKLAIRMRKYTDHRVEFETTYDMEHGAVAPATYIRVDFDESYVTSFNNGVITADGRVTSTTPLGDGVYPVVAWDGSAAIKPFSTTLSIAKGVGSLPGHVFTVVQTSSQVRTYRVETIRPLEDGRFAITALHAPTNSSGMLLAAVGWDDPGQWLIEP